MTHTHQEYNKGIIILNVGSLEREDNHLTYGWNGRREKICVKRCVREVDICLSGIKWNCFFMKLIQFMKCCRGSFALFFVCTISCNSELHYNCTGI